MLHSSFWRHLAIAVASCFLLVMMLILQAGGVHKAFAQVTSPVTRTAPTGLAGLPRLSDEEKNKLKVAAAAFSTVAVGAGTATYTSCPTLIAPMAIATCEIAAGSIGGVSGLVAIASGAAASDPPDPNFKVIALPILVPAPQVTTAQGFTENEANAIDALDNNLMRESALENALSTSINRAQGAQLAEDKVWEDRQLAAAQQYAGQAAQLLKAEPKLFNDVQTTEDTRFKSDPKVNNFYQMLTSPSLDSATLQAAQALEQFATSR